MRQPPPLQSPQWSLRLLADSLDGGAWSASVSINKRINARQFSGAENQ
jgi:hypothetical protein